MVGKQVKKFIKGTWHNVGSIESWLSYMALEGLLVSDVGKIRATFEQGERTKAEYRIKYLPFEIEEGDTSLKRSSLIELFGNYGWEKVCSDDDIYIFRSIDDEDYEELPVYDFEARYFKNRMNKKMGAIIYSALIVAYFYFSFLRYNQFIKRGGLALFGLIVCILLISIIMIVELICSKKKLQQKRKNNINWRSRYLKRLITLFILGCIILTSFIYVVTLEQPEKQLLDDSYTAVIRLNDIEQSEESIELDKDNYIIHSSTFLAPEYYYLYEREKVADDLSIEVNYYELRFKMFAQGLVKDIAPYRYVYNEIKEVESDFFDYVGSYTNENLKELYLIKGNIVVSVDYNGSKTMEEVLKIVEEKLASQYKLHNLFDLH